MKSMVWNFYMGSIFEESIELDTQSKNYNFWGYIVEDKFLYDLR